MSELSGFEVRSRTFTWRDPRITLERSREMSGMEFLRAVLCGELPPPPIAELMEMRLAEVEEGRVVFASQPREFHYNPIGAVHGGFAATLLDSAMGCAVGSVLPAGVSYTTLEIKINLVRALTDTTGPVTAQGQVIHVGKRTATAEGRLTDATGGLYAFGTTTCLIIQA
jgi:uncharacterized protein (TIGR00369 family)